MFIYGSQDVIHKLASHFSHHTNQSLVLEKHYHVCSYCSFVGRKVFFSRGSFLLYLSTKNQLLRRILALCWVAMISVQLAALSHHWSLSDLMALPGENITVMSRKHFCCLAPVHSGTPVCVHLAYEISYWNKLCVWSALQCMAQRVAELNGSVQVW